MTDMPVLLGRFDVKATDAGAFILPHDWRSLLAGQNCIAGRECAVRKDLGDGNITGEQ